MSGSLAGGPVAIYDSVTAKYLSVDSLRNLRVAQLKRIIGSNFGSSIDSSQYTTTVGAAGSVTVANAVCTLATGGTANGTARIVSVRNARNLSGRPNLFRGVIRFGDTGAANNVREFGIYIDSNNQFTFRLSGTTFQVVAKRAGVETVVSSGEFNGNGTGSGGSWTVIDTFQNFEITYMFSKIRFIINDTPIHAFSPSTTSIVGSLVGSLYANNINSGGSTANAVLDIGAWSVSFVGDAVNNPNFYCNSATAETRTLKGGGGTLYSVTVGKTGGANALLTIYDNTAASGTLIAIIDLTKDSTIGTHNFAPEGVNFYNGLTYVSSGTMTGGAFTITWD